MIETKVSMHFQHPFSLTQIKYNKAHRLYSFQRLQIKIKHNFVSSRLVLMKVLAHLFKKWNNRIKAMRARRKENARQID
jgi:hypothetical protein